MNASTDNAINVYSAYGYRQDQFGYLSPASQQDIIEAAHAVALLMNYAKDSLEDAAYAVECEAPISGYWQGLAMRGLTHRAAQECARVKSAFGNRNVRVVRDPANDGRASNGQWI